MYFRSLATAVPNPRWNQAQCWDALRDTAAVRQLSARARHLLEKVLLANNGIEHRHFA
ncbi:MAG: hypothetical protein RLZZ244_3107, partial [Verrucomicrobiota bacterium]